MTQTAYIPAFAYARGAICSGCINFDPVLMMDSFGCKLAPDKSKMYRRMAEATCPDQSPRWGPEK
jgi:hypothetical protein